MAAAGRQLEEMEENISGDFDSLAEDDGVRRVLGLPPSSKRRRFKPRPSGYTAAPKNTPGTPSSELNPPTNDSASLRPEEIPQIAVTPSTPMPASNPGPAESQGLSLAAFGAIQRYGEWLEEDPAGPGNGEEVFSWSSPLAGLLSQNNTVPGDTQAYAPSSRLLQSPDARHVPDSLVVGGQESSTADQQGNTQVPSATEASPEWPSDGRPRRYRNQEIDGFPSSTEELPANISLEDICRLYPNHLIGHHLRPFIREGWTAQMMWDAQNDSAKGTGAIKRPWNKYEHRILKEKKLMDEEGETARQNQRANSSQHSPGANVQGLVSVMGNNQRETLGAQPANPYQSATFGTGSPQHANDGASVPVEERRAKLRTLLSQELENQGRLIAMRFLNDDPRWNLESRQVRGQRIDEEWIRRAKRLEMTFALNHDIDIEGITSDRNSVKGLLARLKAMVAALSTGTASSAAGTTSSGNLLSKDEKDLQEMKTQLGVLRGWTTEWREQLGGRLRSTPAATGGKVLSSTQQQQSSHDALQNPNAGQHQSSQQTYASATIIACGVSGAPAGQPDLQTAGSLAANDDHQPSALPPADDFSYERLLEEDDVQGLE